MRKALNEKSLYDNVKYDIVGDERVIKKGVECCNRDTVIALSYLSGGYYSSPGRLYLNASGAGRISQY